MSGILNSTGAVSGILGTTVGTPSGGKVLQVKLHNPSGTSGITSSTNYPSTALGFDSPIKSSSDVLICLYVTVIKGDSNTGSYVYIHANGGGIGSGATADQLCDGLLYQNVQNTRDQVAVATYDSSPGSTTPTYNFYIRLYDSLSLGVSAASIVLMEIAG